MSSNYVWQKEEAEQRIRARREAAAAHRLAREARAGDTARLGRERQMRGRVAAPGWPRWEGLRGLFRPARRLAAGACEGG
jgi:hypothetical protein